MEIRRDRYLNSLIRKKNNGMIKVITGIRRSGKSYLLFQCAGHGTNSVRDKLTTGFYRQV